MTTERSQCPVCRCFHPNGVKPCPNYDQLHDALFDGAEVELSESEASTLRWLAGTADWQTRESLVSLIHKARGIRRP